jgi:hypothetical protein
MQTISVNNSTGTHYMAGELLGQTDSFKIYKCVLPDDKEGFLKITCSAADNGLLDKEAYILETLRKEAEDTEAEYAKIKTDDKMLNYQLCFPSLIDSFISEDQQGRRINILSLNQTSEKIADLAPISHLVSKERAYIDPRTSAWILGKLLKLLVFAHDQGISVGLISGDNILIQREKHYVSIFDWSQALFNGGGVPEDIASDEISKVTEEVILALGGDIDTGKLLPSDQLVDSQYEDFLKKLLAKKFTNAKEAHEKFYELIRSIWPREFHPFTTHRI